MHKLSDGTFSINYKVGDKFIVTGEHHSFEIGEVVELVRDDASDCPYFTNFTKDKVFQACYWSSLTHKTEFTLDDIEYGMEITLRDGGKRAIIGGVHPYTGDVCLLTAEVDKNVFTVSGSLLRIYRLKSFGQDSKFTDIIEVSKGGEVIWKYEEPDPKELRIKELEDIILKAKKELENL